MTESTLALGKDDAVPTDTTGHGSVSDASDTATDAAALPIEYRYFSFETPLPAPNLESTGASGAAAPPAPDLQAFVDPHLWSPYRKNTMLALSCFATYLTAYAAGSFSPPAQRMADAFGVSLTVVLFAGITVFCLGFALAPMVLAPFSEYNGRYPVFVAAGTVFVVAQLVCGAAPHLAVMLVARLFVGIGGSVFSTMVGGVIADMWHADGRNTPMTLYSGGVLLGTGCGPLISGVITYRTTYPQNAHDDPTSTSPGDAWRWVFWHQAIADFVMMVALVLVFYESRGSVLLSRKARALNDWYEAREAAGFVGVWMSTAAVSTVPGTETENTKNTKNTKNEKESDTMQLRRVRWVCKDDEGRTTLLHTVSLSVYRPFHMFCTEPVVFFFSLWVAFAWAILYLMFGSVFLVFERTYGFNMQQAGYAFAALLIGAVVATVIGLYQDVLLAAVLRRLLPTRLHGHPRLDPAVPEARLYAACFTSALLPAGLFVFGFTARPDVHWAVPMLGLGISTVGIFAVYLATFNYFADVYHRFASSALAAQSCARNVLGGVFPLVMRPLFLNLGTAHAGALLGAIGAALTFVPWVLVVFGEVVRRRSTFAMSLA